MVITGAERELIIIGVLPTKAPTHLLKLFFKASRSIPEALENTCNARNIIVVFLQPRIIIHLRFVLSLDRTRGNKQLVGVGSNGETVIFIDRYHQRSTQTHVCRDEFAIGIAAEINLATNV